MTRWPFVLETVEGMRIKEIVPNRTQLGAFLHRWTGTVVSRLPDQETKPTFLDGF